MADNDHTPPGKGNADTHRAQRAFVKSCDASRAVARMANAVTAELSSNAAAIPIETDPDEDDSLVIALEGAIGMNTQRSARAMRLAEKKPRARTNR